MTISTAVHPAKRYKIVIIPEGQKGPNHAGWQNSHATVEQYDRAIACGQNVGIMLGARGGVIDMEVDGPEGEESLRKLFNGDPPDGPTWLAYRGKHRLYLYDSRFDDFPIKIELADYPGLEFRLGGASKGAQSLAPPSTADGFKREWENDCEPTALPEAAILKILEGYASKPKPAVFESLFGNAQQKKVAELLAWVDRFDVPLSGKQSTNDQGAIVLPFEYCPKRGHEDGGAVLFVNEDGSHVYHCHHTKCQGTTFADLEAKYGPFGPQPITIGPDLHRVAAEAMQALRRADVYNRGGLLSQIVTEARQPKLCLADNGAPRLRPVPIQSLTLLLSEHARWQAKVQTQNGVKIKRVAPPTQIAGALINAPSLPGIPVITGIVSCPILRADGSIAMNAGYDKATGLFLDVDGDWPAPMSIAEAVRRFADVLHDFPFETPAHKSACIAALVTMVSRYAFGGPAPGFFFDANVSRIGKGLATDMLTMIAEGRKASRMSFSEDDNEVRKTITASAIAGSSYIIFDNCKGRVGGKSLEGAMTAGRWSDRLLGSNQMIDLPFTPTWLFTGNNAVLSTDMIGRLLMARLYSPEESPGARTGFRHADLLGYVKQHRRELVMAALSIPYHYIRAGRPKQAINSWGGFDQWNDLVRASLVWAELPDPDTRSLVAEESDEESSILRQLLEAWPKGAWPVAAIVKLLQTGNYSDVDPYPVLREAVAELPGHDKAQALGRVLRDSRGRVLNGKRFVREGGKNGRRWAVETI